MAISLTGLQIRNFRSLADITIKTDRLNVLFGPNGAGKSTFLDTIWFMRDCAINGVDEASSFRSHGIGTIWDGAAEGANLSIKLETELADYEVLFGYSSGRIEPFVGEMLYAKDRQIALIDRKIGSDKANFYSHRLQEFVQVAFSDPEKLALSCLAFEEFSPPPVYDLDKLLRFVHFYPSRKMDLQTLKRRGSELSRHTWVSSGCQNLWSVLQNISGRRDVDERYDTILDFMRKSFPTFKGLVIDPTSPGTVYGSFIEKGLREPIRASGVSDGHLQMLALLTALFSEGKDRYAMILFDEPEISLHPYALAIFADAVKTVVKGWNKQVFIATHSPVLISQFEPINIFATERDESGKTMITRVSEIDGIKDLLEDYATGSLYMAEMIAPQSQPSFDQEERHA